ncbi:MFS transporter [Homoserinibacter sp. YIM 151385]|uniref:MFS transporter n=1 Tax=Homoserinibacter sp. YIM 151385 TaxID=2985506 RepID=UPI0022F07BB0|nr:MFS transporter [Homoserinibacter sp. YIM 151385]WBU38489.1 MFS transporter [Homoserinibacter sp. YIM 151385]
MNSARSWVVFSAAVLAYLIGVTQRTSFGVAGVDATERFGVTAAALSTVAVVQIVVYAGLQIPVGMLVDRLGPKTLIMAGAAIMAAGQVLLAFSEHLALALAARVLVGIGDALTFVSVIRLLPTWFRGRILPQLSQWVGVLGQLGQLLAAFPFALLLHSAGWRPAFLVASSVSILAVVVVALLVRRGEAPPLTGPVPTTGVVARLRASLARPGTQLGFWVHMLAGAPATVLAIMWGAPFLTAGLGYPLPQAASVLSLLVLGGLIAGPPIGYLAARFPNRRSNLVLAVMSILFAVWLAVMLWPGQPPLWLVAAMFVTAGAGGPGSLVGFDVARTFNPSHALGSASGIVNSGGFIAGFAGMLGIGLVLDVLDAQRRAAGLPADLYALESFRVAMLVPVGIAGLALLGMLVARRRTRRRMRDEQGIAIAPLWVALYVRFRRRGGPAA